MANGEGEPAAKADPRSLYDRDGFSWGLQQAKALRQRDLEAIDWENVAEEIESYSRQQRSRWRSHCQWAIELLLVIEHSVDTNRVDLQRWLRELALCRCEMAEVIEDNPGLKEHFGNMLQRAWSHARERAVSQLELRDSDSFPVPKGCRRYWEGILPRQCPYSLAEIAGYDPLVDAFDRLEADALPKHVEQMIERQFDDLAQRA